MPHKPAPPKLDTAKSRKEAKIDEEIEETFPASDPPAFSGGRGIIGAPPERESKPVKGDSKLVKSAEKKVHSGDAKKTKTY